MQCHITTLIFYTTDSSMNSNELAIVCRYRVFAAFIVQSTILIFSSVVIWLSAHYFCVAYTITITQKTSSKSVVVKYVQSFQTKY